MLPSHLPTIYCPQEPNPPFFCLVTSKLTAFVKMIHKPQAYCGDPRTREQIKPRGPWNAGMEEPDPYRPPLPHVVTINGTV